MKIKSNRLITLSFLACILAFGGLTYAQNNTQAKSKTTSTSKTWTLFLIFSN